MTFVGRTDAPWSSLLAPPTLVFAPPRLVRRCALALLVSLPPIALALEPPALVPAPLKVEWPGEKPIALLPGSVAIVIGQNASDPEQAAARLLQQFVAKRFGEQWPILREGQEQASHKTLMILGQRTTCQRLDDLCRKLGIALSETAPGPDGYVIQMANEADRLLVLMGGCNARGVEYGQDPSLRCSAAQRGNWP
jgi:hypothetical protein